jgi:hypothetical protein
MIQGSNPVKGRRIFSSLNVQTRCGPYPASYSVGGGGRGKAVRGEIYLRIVSRLRISGALPPLPSICPHDVDRVTLTFYVTYNILIITIYMRLKAFTQIQIKQMTNVHYLPRVVQHNAKFDWLPHLILLWAHRISLSATIDTLHRGFCSALQLLQANDK